MGNRFINRYNTFCKSLANLEKCKNTDVDIFFLLPATVQNYNLTFDISWKVMKDLIVKHFGFQDFGLGSPRDTLQKAFTVGIIDDDVWLQMLRTRNQLVHDYDGELALSVFKEIVGVYLETFQEFKKRVEKYYSDGGLQELQSFK